jgi:RHS repeat-associated protein
MGSGTLLTPSRFGGTTLNEYIYFSGGFTARRDSSGNVYYYFGDQLGTTKTLTTSAGVVCYDADFLPFGQEMVYTNSCPQNYKFTSLERDSETGLDHTLFRKYDSSLGRWLSPDRHRGNPFNPQSWGRYAYVLNNPATFTDRLGLEPCFAPLDDEAGDGDSGGDCGDDGGGGSGGGDDDDSAGGGAAGGDDDGGGSSAGGNDNGGSGLPPGPTDPEGNPCYDGSGNPTDCSQIGPPQTVNVTGTADSLSAVALAGVGVLAIDLLCPPCDLVTAVAAGAVLGLGIAALQQSAAPPSSGRQAKCTHTGWDWGLGMCTYECDDGLPYATPIPAGGRCEPVIYKNWGD